MKVELIKDSIANSIRISTFILEYPRFIHCFHPSTEFLSQVNNEFPKFRLFDEIVALGAKVAQYTEQGAISFVSPLQSIKKIDTDGLVTYSGKLNIKVTKKHRMFSQRRSTGNVYSPCTDLAEAWLGGYTAHRRIPQAGYLKDRNGALSPEEAALIAYYVADGHRPVSGNTVNFHFRKQRKIDHVVELLNSLGINFTLSQYNDDVVIRFLPPYWVDDCYTETGEKKYPDFIWDMSKDSFKAFKLATLLSDGNLDNQEINTTSVCIAEQTQVIALLNDVAMNIKSYGQPGYKNLYKQSYQQTNYASFRADKDVFAEEAYTGEVVCFTVPSSYLIVRLEGTAYVSGNCELCTHRQFSRNAASSRAIPTSAIIQNTRDNPAEAVWWGKNMSGMQAKEALTGWRLTLAKAVWASARELAIIGAKLFNRIGLHKQLANRILEPFQNIRVVVTATEWNNFFNLRDHEHAQPEFAALARMMKEAMDDSTPTVLQPGEWHIPYVDSYRTEDNDIKYFVIPEQLLTLKEALMVSASMAAQESYRKSDPSPEKAKKIFAQLVESKPCHASPVEHQAMAMMKPFNEHWHTQGDWETGTTHVDKAGNFWSGNIRGWIQHRQLIPNHDVKG